VATVGEMRLAALLPLVLVVSACGSGLPAPPRGYERIGHVADGDTVVLQSGVTIRLVQIDTPEVFFRPECFGEQASAETKRLLPKNTLVRLARDPTTDSADQYGRLLRYVIRSDGLDINVSLVADGYAAPYFFDGVRGDKAPELEQLALTAQRERLGLWGACPSTPYAPEHGVDTGPPQ
jgi:micrococcal nuclease